MISFYKLHLNLFDIKKFKKINCQNTNVVCGRPTTKRKLFIGKGSLLSKFPNDPTIRGDYYKWYKDYSRLKKEIMTI